VSQLQKGHIELQQAVQDLLRKHTETTKTSLDEAATLRSAQKNMGEQLSLVEKQTEMKFKELHSRTDSLSGQQLSAQAKVDAFSEFERTVQVRLKELQECIENSLKKYIADELAKTCDRIDKEATEREIKARLALLGSYDFKKEVTAMLATYPFFQMAIKDDYEQLFDEFFENPPNDFFVRMANHITSAIQENANVQARLQEALSPTNVSAADIGKSAFNAERVQKRVTRADSLESSPSLVNRQGTGSPVNRSSRRVENGGQMRSQNANIPRRKLLEEKAQALSRKVDPARRAVKGREVSPESGSSPGTSVDNPCVCD